MKRTNKRTTLRHIGLLRRQIRSRYLIYGTVAIIEFDVTLGTLNRLVVTIKSILYKPVDMFVNICWLGAVQCVLLLGVVS